MAHDEGWTDDGVASSVSAYHIARLWSIPAADKKSGPYMVTLPSQGCVKLASGTVPSSACLLSPWEPVLHRMSHIPIEDL